MTEIAVLVSVGRHPGSLRPRRADLDARALEVALRSGAGPAVAVHAGSLASEPVLRDYVGMGATRLDLIALDEGLDPACALAEHLRGQGSPIILAGTHAEQGEGSGLLPFVLAEWLAIRIVTEVVELRVEGETAIVTKALAGGRRQRISLSKPVICTVGKTGPAPRLSAFARARRGEIVTHALTPAGRMAGQAWPVRPARPRPLQRAGGPTGNATDRLGAILSGSALGEVATRRSVQGAAPDDAARAILDYLVGEGLIDRPGSADEGGMS